MDAPPGRCVFEVPELTRQRRQLSGDLIDTLGPILEPRRCETERQVPKLCPDTIVYQPGVVHGRLLAGFDDCEHFLGFESRPPSDDETSTTST